MEATRPKTYGDLEELFYGWDRFEERELFDELARRCRAYLAAYQEWENQFK